MRKLKQNTVYLDKRSGHLCIMVRVDKIFSDKGKTWQLEFLFYVYSEELNHGFRKDIAKNYTLLGDL